MKSAKLIPIIEPSPCALNAQEKDWIFNKLRHTSLGFQELCNLVEKEPNTDGSPVLGGNRFSAGEIQFFINFLEYECFDVERLRKIPDERLKRFIEKKAVEADILRQKGHLENLLEGLILDRYHPERMLDLIEEAANEIIRCNGSSETLAKLQGYIELSKPD